MIIDRFWSSHATGSLEKKQIDKPIANAIGMTINLSNINWNENHCFVLGVVS